MSPPSNQSNQSSQSNFREREMSKRNSESKNLWTELTMTQPLVAELASLFAVPGGTKPVRSRVWLGLC